MASDPPPVCFSSIVKDARARLGENAQQSGYEQVIASIPAKSRREKGDFALASSRARSFAPICPVSPEKSLLRSLYLLAGALFLSWVLCVHRGPHWHQLASNCQCTAGTITFLVVGVASTLVCVSIEHLVLREQSGQEEGIDTQMAQLAAYDCLHRTLSYAF